MQHLYHGAERFKEKLNFRMSSATVFMCLFEKWDIPYLKCPQRRLYSAWKIADIYLRRSAEYWDALSASLRKLEIFSVRTSAIFPYAGPQLSAERSADVCGHQCGNLCGRLCGRPHGLVRTSAWIVRTSAWMGADVCGSPHGWVRTSTGPEDLLELLPLLCNNLLIICGIT